MVRKFCVRQADKGDIRQLLSIERKCWEPHLRANEQKILRYLNNSRHQFVAEVNRKVIGVLFTQRIRSDVGLRCGKFATQLDLHDNSGAILQLCAIAVDGDICDGNIGAELRNYALKFARSLGGAITRVVAMTRCSEFDCLSLSPDLPRDRKNAIYKEYVYKVRDPTIFFHVSGGAKILDIIHDYRQEDRQNLGHGVLIAYDILQVKYYC